jgi:hypothetical protein
MHDSIGVKSKVDDRMNPEVQDQETEGKAVTAIRDLV